MAIDIDISGPLRGPRDLQRLVDAVVAAGSADETGWLECKSDLDLTKAEGRYKVARAVLGFANRMPDAAANACGGLAYLLIGAEPGQVSGTQVIDTSSLEHGLTNYLGGDGPVWTPLYLQVDGKDVLVVTVEPPKWGDRMATLRKQGNGLPPGTVFVRAQSNTRPANDDEIKMLEDRFARGHQTPEIGGLKLGYKFTSATATPLLVFDHTEEAVEDWIQQRREAIHAWHQAAIDAIEAPPQGNLAAVVMFRRPKIDVEAIERHLELCRQHLFDAARQAMVEHNLGLLQLTAHNPGRRTLDNVELTLTLDTPFSAFPEGRAEELKPLPKPPAPPKQKDSSLLAGYFGSAIGDSAGLGRIAGGRIGPTFHAPYMPVMGIEIEGNSITLDLYQIRPEKTGASTSFHLCLHQRPATDTVPIAWTLTSTSTEGVQRGTIQIPTLTRPGVLPILLPPTDGLPDKEPA